jgi:peptide/nickel transport system substrate-binding protein
VVVDDNTVRIDFIKKDRLTIPDLAVIVPGVYNSGLVKKNATEKDPWALEYTKSNTAGSGAYKVTSWKPGVEVSRAQRRLGRRQAASAQEGDLAHDALAGQPPRLMERGDADISFDLPSKDFGAEERAGKLVIISNPIGNGMYSVELNVKKPPFDNIRRSARRWPMRCPIRRSWTRRCSASPIRCSAARPTRSPSIAWPAKTGYFTTSPRPRR